MLKGTDLPSLVNALKFDCQAGVAKKLEMPPPLAPPLAPSFHTVSLAMLLCAARRLVPPQASANGLEAGKSTWSAPSLTPSEEPLSPDATHTVMPMVAAAWSASSMAVIACAVQLDSGPPQL